jgi:hypothetical protein
VVDPHEPNPHGVNPQVVDPHEPNPHGVNPQVVDPHEPNPHEPDHGPDPRGVNRRAALGQQHPIPGNHGVRRG